MLLEGNVMKSLGSCGLRGKRYSSRWLPSSYLWQAQLRLSHDDFINQFESSCCTSQLHSDFLPSIHLLSWPNYEELRQAKGQRGLPAIDRRNWSFSPNPGWSACFSSRNTKKEQELKKANRLCEAERRTERLTIRL